MIVVRGRSRWEIPDGCKRVRPNAAAKSVAGRLAASLDACGVELWSSRGIWVLAPGNGPVRMDTYQHAYYYGLGLQYGYNHRARIRRALLRARKEDA